MQKILFSKPVIIGFIALILLIPLQLISEKISERSLYLSEAKRSVSESWTGGQTIMGPLVVIPYDVEHHDKVWDKDKNQETIKIRKESKLKYILPESVSIVASVTVSNRYKGIYKVPVYTTLLNLSGVIDRQIFQKSLDEIELQGNPVTIGRPYFTTNISDPRGINTISRLTWLDKELIFLPGSQIRENTNGIHAHLPVENLPNSIGVPFSFQLELRGMEELSFSPIGNEVKVKVSSSWQHPEFVGNFLPVSRTIDETGYQAEWLVSSFASNIAEKVQQCEQGNCSGLLASSFGVKHIEPVDVYLQSERSVKYGLLFIGLSFVAFFIFEVLKKLPIHAIQYTLVGFAIAIFYMLLVSLSEHIAFWMAYFISTICCVGLLQFYLSYVLRGFKKATAFSILLFMLYSILYVIISAEDFAMLMGALLVFVALAVVMISTRKIDWYAEGERVTRMQTLKASTEVE